MNVGEYMHTNIITVPSEMRVRDAEKVMNEHKIRRLPVVDKNRLMGLVTRSKIREATGHHATSLTMWELNYLIQKMRVKDIMETELYTVTSDTPIDKAIYESQELGISTLLVVEKDRPDKLIGITTTTDLYKLAASVLGLGQPGIKMRIHRPDNLLSSSEILRIITQYDVDIRSFYKFTSAANKQENCVVNLGGNNLYEIEEKLKQKGYEVEVSQNSFPETAATAKV